MNRLANCAAAVLAALMFNSAAGAQNYPQQPIHMIVAFGAGGGSDIIARILADAMQKKLGKPVVVENKPGAGESSATTSSPRPRRTATRSES